MNALFQRLADAGRIDNREKFKCLGNKGADLWEFKSFQLRFIGDFRRGGIFVVAHAVRKKSDDLSPSDIRTALRVLQEDDQREKGHDRH